jgi:hypothetical protein
MKNHRHRLLEGRITLYYAMKYCYKYCQSLCAIHIQTVCELGMCVCVCVCVCVRARGVKFYRDICTLFKCGPHGVCSEVNTGLWLDASGSGWGPVVGSCEHGMNLWFHKRKGIS